MKIHIIEPYLNETNLKDVLEFIFETEIKRQFSIHTYRTARVDYYFELPHNKQKVFVEFNGIRHYTLTDNIQRDYMLRCYAKEENIRLVEIPYFVQLTNYTIPQYFGWEVEQYLEGKEIITPIECGFHEKKIVLPWDFCVKGLERFAKDMQPISHVQNSNYEIDKDAEFWKTPQQIWNSLHNRSNNDLFNMRLLIDALKNDKFNNNVCGTLENYPT